MRESPDRLGLIDNISELNHKRHIYQLSLSFLINANLYLIGNSVIMVLGARYENSSLFNLSPKKLHD